MIVLIKGTEMPKCDIDCPIFTEEICPVESVSALSKMKEERPPDCPIVPVPEHGRLIDADALMKQIEHDTPLSAVFEKTMRRYLHNAPTIIPAELPVHHGTFAATSEQEAIKRIAPAEECET